MASKAKIYIYKEGNECSTITGGWIEGFRQTASNDATIRVSKNSNNLELYCNMPVDPYRTEVITFITSNSINCNLFDSATFVSDMTYTGEDTTNTFTGYGLVTSKANQPCSSDLSKIYTRPNLLKETFNIIIIQDAGNRFIGFDITSRRYSTSSTKLYNAYLTTKENVITINSQTQDNIIFTCNNLGLVTITKAEVLINNAIVQTYTSNFTNVNYTIDKSKLSIGTNKIEIKVTYSQGDNITSTVSEILTQTYKPSILPTNVGLKSKNDRDEALYNGLVVNRDNLKNNLSNKGVDVTGVNEMSNLIDKVGSIATPTKTVASDNYLIYAPFSNSCMPGGETSCIRILSTFKGSVRVTASFTSSYWSYFTVRTYKNSILLNSNPMTSSSISMSVDFVDVNVGDVLEFKLYSTNTFYQTLTLTSFALKGGIV